MKDNAMMTDAYFGILWKRIILNSTIIVGNGMYVLLNICKGAFMKNFGKLIGIIAMVTIIGFLVLACDDASGSSSDSTGIHVGQLPEFPSGSTPAATKSDAETILEELGQSQILQFFCKEIGEVVDQNSHNSENYSFSNRSLPNGYVKVSASETEKETNTGGFKALSASWKTQDDLLYEIDALYETYPVNYAEIDRLYDEIYLLEEERNNIKFAKGDRGSYTYNRNEKGELTRDKTEDDVTVAQGSIYETKYTNSGNRTVTTAGTYTTFRANGTYSEKEQTIASLTVTTLRGSLKIILDMIREWRVTENNDNIDNTEKYSGSLKVYGIKNVLLIDHRIVDLESYNIAEEMICFNFGGAGDLYEFDPADATSLANNVIINGNIDFSGSYALYSINVTSGTEYHLWWDDSDTNWNHIDVGVRGYYSNGDMFFDMYYDWINYYSFTATSTGTVYIMVYSYYDTGSFTIVYNTTGNQPAMSVSFAAPLSTNSRSVQDKTGSFVIPRKSIGVLRHNSN